MNDSGERLVLTFRDHLLDVAGRRLIAPGGHEIPLKPRVFDTLAFLVANPGRVLTKQVLLEAVWPGAVVEENNLNQAISALRRAFGDTRDEPRFIATIAGRGYQFVAEVRTVAVQAPASGSARTSGVRRVRVTGPWLVAVIAMLVATLSLLALLRGSAPSLRPEPGATDSRPSIAVLPFEDMSTDGGQAYFAEGVTEEIRSRLTRIGDLRVVAHAPGVSRGDEDLDAPALGDALGVRYLLMGSVRREGKRLRVGAHLISVADSTQLWSQTYDRELESVFAVQDEVATEVAEALSVTLGAGMLGQDYGGTTVFEAYDRYLHGRSLRNAVPAERAVNELLAAVSIDPGYARAWSELAVAYGDSARQATTAEALEELFGRMDEASRRAIELAPDLWVSHSVRAWYLTTRHDWLGAERALLRARELGGEGEVDLHYSLAAFHNQVGRSGRFAAHREAMLRLDPLVDGGTASLFQAHFMLGRYQEAFAVRELRLGQGSQPDRFTDIWLALVLGDEDLADALMRAYAASDDATWMFDQFVDVWRSPADALEVLGAMAREPAGTYRRNELSAAALMAGHRGDTELAVTLMRQALLGPGWAGYVVLWYPQLAEARRTAAFRQLVRDIGFAAFWRTTGDWGDYCRPVSETSFECV